MNNNPTKVEKLKALIESSDSVLITSHISPDPDALCSVLLAGTSLEAKYPGKKIMMSMEELTGELNFLTGYERIVHNPLLKSIQNHSPELIIILDAMNFGRCTRGEISEVKSLSKELGCKLAIIDHHEPDGVDENDIYINNGSPACAQDAYEIFIKGFGVRPEGFAQSAMLGIISDTNRFLYDNLQHKQTFDITDELIDAGASIEKIVYDGSRYSVLDMQVISEAAKNTCEEKGYTYSFLSDSFIEDWLSKKLTADQLKRGGGYYLNEFIRNIGKNMWGFMVYRDIAETDASIYSVSCRSVNGVKDVSALAKVLGGGGHKAAAGAKFEANDVEEAVAKVKAVISGIA
jgi:phosphoesterase RecJ-like protein